MAKKKFKDRSAETVQESLKAYLSREPVTFAWLEFRTDFHLLRIKDVTRDNFIEKLGAKLKSGDEKYTTEAQHMKMCEFIQKHAKPREPKMNGGQWEASMRALMQKVFDRDWDKRFHRKTGEEIPEGMKENKKADAPA